MATGTNGIATRENANAKKANSYSSDLKRCITYASATSVGFVVTGVNLDRYRNNTNRLMRYSDLVAGTIEFWITIDISSDASLYNNGPIKFTNNNPTSGANGQPPIPHLSLTKANSSVNLLPNNISESSDVSSDKKVSFKLFSKLYYGYDNGAYTLTYKSWPVRYLANKSGYPAGSLYVSSSSTAQTETITVNNPGKFTFNAYWKKSGSTPPTPPPQPTLYTFKLLWASTDTPYQIYLEYTCEIHDRNLNMITSFYTQGTTFTVSEMILDTSQASTGGYAYYVIKSLSCNLLPYYATIDMQNFKYKTSASDVWRPVDYRVENTEHGLVGGTGTTYTTLHPSGKTYTLNYVS